MLKVGEGVKKTHTHKKNLMDTTSKQLLTFGTIFSKYPFIRCIH